MTVLEKGKFVKNFVRTTKDNKLFKITHSNIRGYSAKDIANIEPKIDPQYFENWGKIFKRY